MSEIACKTGPWWVTTFHWHGRLCVMRFKIERGSPGGGWRPGRCELCAFTAGDTPSAAAKRRAAEAFIAANARIIRDAFALAEGEPARGVFAPQAVALGIAVSCEAVAREMVDGPVYQPQQDAVP